MQRNVIETLVGGLVLLIAIGFGYFAYSVTSVGGRDGYTLSARFDRVDGLSVGSDVRVSGVKVGVVTDLRLDPKTYLATLTFEIGNGVKVPADSVAQIASEGLLGGNFLNIVPGSADETLPSGGTIRFTQAPVNFMDMLGRFIFSTAEQQGKAGGAAPAPAQPVRP